MHKHDIVKGDKARTIIEVPILRAENFGAKMAIDEKHIGEDICTVISNRETGKIAMLTKSLNYSDIKDIFLRNKPLLENIRSITRDFSGLFEKVCTELIPHATQIGDKFHVISNLMDAHQSVRIRYRRKELEKRRKAYQEFKHTEQARLKECERMGQKFKSDKFHYKEDRMDNGDIIRNYFINGDTNAIAEAINSKIQKLITSNNGNRDKDFFFFRLALYYA